MLMVEIYGLDRVVRNAKTGSEGAIKLMSEALVVVENTTVPYRRE